MEQQIIRVSTLRPALVSVEDARKYLGNISRAKLYEMIGAGDVRTAKIGGRRMVAVASMDAFIAANMAAPGDVAA